MPAGQLWPDWLRSPCLVGWIHSITKDRASAVIWLASFRVPRKSRFITALTSLPDTHESASTSVGMSEGNAQHGPVAATLIMRAGEKVGGEGGGVGGGCSVARAWFVEPAPWPADECTAGSSGSKLLLACPSPTRISFNLSVSGRTSSSELSESPAGFIVQVE